MMNMTISAPLAAAQSRSSKFRWFGITSWFANRSVRTKILSAVGALALISLVVTLVTISGLSKAGEDIDDLADVNTNISGQITALRIDFEQERTLISDLATAQAAQESGNYAEQITALDGKIDEVFKNLGPRMAGKHDAVWNPVLASWAQFTQVRDEELMPKIEAGALSGYLIVKNNSYEPAAVNFGKALQDATVYVDSYVSDVQTSASARSSKSITTAWILIIAGLILAIGFGWLLKRCANPSLA